MSPFTLAGLVLAGFSVCAYVVLAWQRGKRPELNDVVVVFLGAGGVVSAIRIIGAVITGHFSKSPIAPANDSVWTLVPDDAAQIVLGGVALAWVSLQTILQIFITIGRTASATRVGHEAGEMPGQISRVELTENNQDARPGDDPIQGPKS
jgi:hypothetical protein